MFPPEALYIIPAVLLTVVLYTTWKGWRFRTALREAAETLSCTYQKDSWFSTGTVRGIRRGRVVEISLLKQGAGSFQRQLTEIRVTARATVTTSFMIGLENTLTRVQRTAGWHDIEIGQEPFDSVMLIQSEDEDWMKRQLNNAVVNTLLTARIGASDLRIDAQGVTWRRARRIMDPHRIVEAVERAEAVVETLHHRATPRDDLG